MDLVPTPCYHSGLSADRVDCASCWYGALYRQNAHLDRVRGMLKDLVGENVLHEHDMRWFGMDYDDKYVTEETHTDDSD